LEGGGGGVGVELKSNVNKFFGVEGFGTQPPPISRGDFTQAIFSEGSKLYVE